MSNKESIKMCNELLSLRRKLYEERNSIQAKINQIDIQIQEAMEAWVNN